MAEFQNETNTRDIVSEQLPGPIQIKKAEGKNPFEQFEIEQTIVKEVMAKFNRWSDWRRNYELLWAEIYKLFMTVPLVSNIPTRARVALPIVFQVVEAALPKLVTVIFGQPEWFQAQSNSTANPVPPEVLEAHQDLLKYQLKLAKFFVKFVDFAKQLFLYGTSYFYVYHKVERQWVYERTPIREPLAFQGLIVNERHLRWEKKLEYKVTERRPEVEVLAIEDVYPDPEAKSEMACEGIFVASSISKAELKELSTGKYPVYANYDKLAETGYGGGDKYQEQQFKVDKRTIRGSGTTSFVDNKDNVELLTFWGKYDLDGDGIREEVQLVFANRSCLIKAIRNPFEHQKRPIVRGVLFPVPFEWYGLGLVEPIIALIHELYTIRNQYIDMNNLILNRMWKVATWADVDLDTLVTSPNGAILTGDMDGIQELEQQTLPGSVTEMSLMLQTDIENASAPKSIQGSPTSGALGRTARGAQLIITQALEKFGMGAKLIEESVIVEVLRMFKQLNEQFLDEDDKLEHFYGHIIQGRLTPELLRAELDFTLLGISETITSEATINQLISLYNLVAQRPDIDSTGLLYEIARKMKLQTPVEQLLKPVAMPQVAQVVGNPNVSEGTEEALIQQIQQNGAGGAVNLPQAG
ncbi:MAG: hypothetical protein AB7V39_00565 [Nitrospiraceae bacterium]